MEKIKPKKERKFLKAMGDIALTLFRELVLGIGKKVINKVGNKRQGLVIAFALVAGISYASIDSIPYPITGNKQRLGWQTSGNGLVYRGRAADTITKPSSYVDKNVKAYLLVDSVLGTIFVWRQTYWDSIKVNTRLMPFDSITFNTAKNGTVGVGEVEYNDTQGSLIQGLKGGNVTNVIGQQLHQRVNNRTGATLAKGTAVYLSGSQGNRITVAKALATSDPTSANTFGIVAESIDNNQSGYVITEGLITNINTSALVEDSAVYLSPTVAGGLTSTKPQAPQHNVYIGVCVKSNAGSGELFVSIKNGLEITELHDVQITSPVDRASLYYKSSEKLWRDTTAALLVSDTASMLANYSLKSYVDSIAQNFQDSIDEITNGYFKQEFPTVTKDTLNWTKPVQLPIGGSNLLLVYRNGQMINDAQYSVIDTNKVKINSGSYKLGENYTVVYVKGGGGSGSGGVPFDTSVLNLQARLDLKLNISDTAAMLANYATKAYADTTGRFYARQDYTTGVTSSTLTWTQNDTLIPGGVNVVQVYRNGQILLPSQYTIPTSTSVVIAASSFKVNDNYTVIFPRGGGASSGGGSGSLTSISAGTGITVSPNPITTTGTVSADLSVLMELTDTSLLNLTSRFATKLNISDTAAMLSNYNTRINSKLNISDTSSMLAPYFLDADTSLLNLTSRFALKLNATDTASLSNRINAKGNGTVTSVATGYGLTGGTISSTGTLLLDSAVVFSRIRDSIVDVAIGNDTIKILKQEYAPATTSILTWTVTPKFPIQLKQYILVFRNGQLLINDQYNLTDTNKITIVSNSFKVGANYTVVTVSGIGSVGTGTFPNPVYPDAGIALSTGTTWASSITNNSSNWNTAFTDRLKWDGGSTGLVAATGRTSLGGTTIGQSMFTLSNPSTISFPRFNADNTITSRSAANFRNDIGAGTVTSVNVAVGTPLSIQNNTTIPEISMAAATGSINGYLTSTDWNTFNGKQAALGNASSTVSGILTSTDWNTFNGKQNQLTGTGFVKASGTSISYDNSSYLRTGLADSTFLKLTGGTLTGNLRLSSSVGTQLNINANDNNLESRITFSTAGSARSKIYTTSSVSSMTFESIAQASAKRGFRFISSTEGTQYLGLVQDPQGNVGIKSDATGNDLHPNTLYVNGTLGVTGNITESGNNVLTNLDTASLSSRIDSKFNSSGGTISGKAILNDSARFEGNVLFKKNMGLPIVKISNADYTATTSNHTIIYTVLTADKTLTIPNASDAIGIKYIISIFDIPEGNEALTLVTPSSNLFVRTDGESSNVDIVGGYCTTIQSDGTKWYILSYAPMY